MKHRQMSLLNKSEVTWPVALKVFCPQWFIRLLLKLMTESWTLKSLEPKNLENKLQK